MAKKKDVETKTTRNKEFNYYMSEFSGVDAVNTVVSATATKAKPNIRLLDASDAIIKSGEDIITDIKSNTNMIELNTGFGSKSAALLAPYAYLTDEQISALDDEGKAEVKRVEKILADEGASLKDLRQSIITDFGTIENDNLYYIFGDPYKTVLNNRQNYNNCGVESTLNTLAMAGIIKMKENLRDQKSVEKNFLNKMVTLGLVEDAGVIGKLDEPDGGTLPDDYRDILSLYGLESESYYITNAHNSNGDIQQYSDINELAYKISQGYGAILGVCSSKLWNETKSESGEIKVDHAIAITGVVYDTNNPTNSTEPVGFYVHDSGAWMTRFISLAEFKDATLYDYVYDEETDEANHKLSTLYETDQTNHIKYTKSSPGIFVTITTTPIKSEMYNLNATGNKYANVIYGNSVTNTIKGMSGNDTLYGGAGDDKIYGGKGNDIIFGNGADTDDISEFQKYVQDSVFNRLDNVTFVKNEYTDKNMIGRNTLYGDAGSDIIFGGNNNDLIYGGKGNDYIYGGSGRDAIYGGKGNDFIFGGAEDDRLFGEAGNDTIYGGDGDDTINGGAGNDLIYSGRGVDKIETGKGNDTVFAEGQIFGLDVISSQGGSTTIKFIDDTNIPDGVTEADKEQYLALRMTDMNFSLEKNEDKSKFMDLQIGFTDEEVDEDDIQGGVQFNEFYNSKKNTYKNVTIVDCKENKYRVGASNSKKASVANVKTNKTNTSIGNLLFSTYTKGATITTSKKNDIVYMMKDSDVLSSTYKTAIDKITYTGGQDKYVSEERNTYYTVSDFNSTTNLLIYDNVQGLTKKEVDIQKILENPDDTTALTVLTNVVSTDDRLYINSGKDSIGFFFNVKLDGTAAITTDEDGLFILNNNENIADSYSNIANSILDRDLIDNMRGFIYMDSFFKYDSDNKTEISASGDFFGNGRIESLYYDKNTKYDDFEADLASIAGEVAKWLSSGDNTAGYTSAFEAFQGGEGNIDKLIQCYTVQNS